MSQGAQRKEMQDEIKKNVHLQLNKIHGYSQVWLCSTIQSVGNSSEACYESLLQRATESEHDETNSKKIVPRMKNRLPIQGCHWSNS